MPQLINLGSELVRINTAANRIECSQNGGRGWVTRCANASYGTLVDLLAYGGELRRRAASSSACMTAAANCSPTQAKVFTIRATRGARG